MILRINIPKISLCGAHSGIVGRIAASMTRREVDHIVSSADRLKDCGGTVTTGDTAGVEESRVANISGSGETDREAFIIG